MEALAGVMGAALTVVDMCKAVDRGMEVSGVKVLGKEGGKGGGWGNVDEGGEKDVGGNHGRSEG